MKKILLTLLLSIFLIQGVDAETVKTYLVKDGVEQTDFTGGSVFEKLEGAEGAMLIQNDHIDFYVDIWAHWTYTFNNIFDYSKYKTLNIDFSFPTTNNETFKQYIFAHFHLQNSGFKQQFLTGGTTERIIYSYSIPEDATEDTLRLGFANLSDGNYINYPLSVYNLWFESEKTEEPIIADTTLNSFYTLYLNKIKSLADYSLENKYVLSAIAIIITFTIIGLFIYFFKKGGYQR